MKNENITLTDIAELIIKKHDEALKYTDESIDKLAIIVNKGFEQCATKEDIKDMATKDDIKKLDQRLDKIENSILRDQLTRIGRLEDKVYKLESAK